MFLYKISLLLCYRNLVNPQRHNTNTIKSVFKTRWQTKKAQIKPVRKDQTHFFEYLLYKTLLRKKIIIFVNNILTSFI